MAQKEVLHVFVYIVDRVEDPFYGIRCTLSRNLNDHKVCDLRFSERASAQVNRIEYSHLRYLRIFFYRRIYSELKKKLNELIIRHYENKRIFIYFADEGVWGEFLMNILRKNHRDKVTTVMVQHGLHYLEQVSISKYVRLILNMISKSFLGYPWFGLGLAGSRFDIYLVYGDKERDFIRSISQSLAFSCPRMIKRAFIERYQNYLRSRKRESLIVTNSKILFAMEPVLPGAGFQGTERDIYKELKNLFYEIICITNQKIIFRLHPGMDRDNTLSLIGETGLVDLIEVDQNKDIAKTICDVDFVISFHSTVLFETLMLGKVPVQILSHFDNRPLHLKLEILNLDCDGDIRIRNIFNQNTIERYRSYIDQMTDELDWLDFVDNYNET